jgi:hypothetical protein
MERVVTQSISAPQLAGDGPPAPTADGDDLAYQRRKRGIYVLAWSIVAFFVVAIATCYIVALAYGYGTGFGDGKEVSSRIRPLGGTGFWGDLGLLFLVVVTDVVFLYAWYWVMSRLDNVSADDPVAPDDRDLDLNDPASWYVVQVPGLTKTLTVLAITCLGGIVIGAAGLIPVVAIRYGWVL